MPRTQPTTAARPAADQWSSALKRVILVANRKGGVLKSSVCRSVAAVAATGGYRVLVIDGDPQGNVSEIDFGIDTDRGRTLAMALHYGTDLTPTTSHGIDVISGGPELHGAMGAAAVPGSEVSLEANLRAALGRLCAAGRYDLVLIDSGPGDTRLLDAYMRTARWLVVPTISDEASFAGVDKMGARYAEAIQHGAEIEFLGAVLTKINHQAVARNRAIRQELADALGSAGEPFKAMIRYNDANAIDARRHGLSAHEVAAQAITQRKSRLADLRQRANGGPTGPRDDQDTWWSRSSTGAALAGDYDALTREILTRISQREAAARASSHA